MPNVWRTWLLLMDEKAEIGSQLEDPGKLFFLVLDDVVLQERLKVCSLKFEGPISDLR